MKQSNSATLGKELATHYLNKTPANIAVNLTIEQAQEVQNKFIEALQPSLGKIVGYKAGLTNQQAQNRFNISEPVQGTNERFSNASGIKIPANVYPYRDQDVELAVINYCSNKAFVKE